MNSEVIWKQHRKVLVDLDPRLREHVAMAFERGVSYACAKIEEPLRAAAESVGQMALWEGETDRG